MLCMLWWVQSNLVGQYSAARRVLRSQSCDGGPCLPLVISAGWLQRCTCGLASLQGFSVQCMQRHSCNTIRRHDASQSRHSLRRRLLLLPSRSQGQPGSGKQTLGSPPRKLGRICGCQLPGVSLAQTHGLSDQQETSSGKPGG